MSETMNTIPSNREGEKEVPSTKQVLAEIERELQWAATHAGEVFRLHRELGIPPRKD